METERPTLLARYRLICVAAATLLLATTAAAQKWRTEMVPDCGIQFSAPNRLERLPMKLGSSAVYQRARLQPKDAQDYVRGQYPWNCDVYSFSKKEQKAEDIKLPSGIPKEMEEQLRKMLAGRGRGPRHKTFADWLDNQDDIDVKQAGKKIKGRNGKLPYEHWIFTKPQRWSREGESTMYCEAAVYDFEDSQTALLIEMPLETKKSKKPKSKWASIIKKMIKSGEPCKDIEDEEDKKRDKYADTPARKAALAKAKANIAGLKGWDYFTQPNYCVFYSWDFEKPDTRSKSRKQAIYYSERLEKMRKLYIESYPLDATGTKAVMPDPSSIPDATGPITGADAKKSRRRSPRGRGSKDKEKGEVPYSVFRLCATYEQFQKYGGTRGGVVGWYSPASKELVVFLGGDKMMGAGATETVTYHEGWHQFADLYFHPPESPKRATLQRWFDEGHGDYFGGHRWGSSGWKYTGSKMRYASCKQMVRKGDYVPFKEIVTWGMRRFYGAKAAYYYAQAFSMIDFLRRGQKSKGWDPKWGEILEMYRRVVSLKGDATAAVEIAFREFDDAEWTKLEEAWKAWVSSGKFLKG